MTDHPLQSSAWGEFRKAMGIDVVRFNTWHLTFHNIPYTPYTIGYFPKGPTPTPRMISKLVELGKSKCAIFIQLEPNVSRITFHVSRLRKSHHPLFTKYTFVLDLTKSEEELLQSMHSKTRYNLKIAAKYGVKVNEDNSPEAFHEYLRLSEETTERQGFYAHNKLYHQTMWKIMRGAGIAHLFTATYQGKTLAAWIIFAYGKTIYYPYGASSREHREVMAPTLLLWEIARWGKSHGFTSFDLWGALGPNPDPRDPWFGFHRFKQGFNPQLVEFVGSYDLVINPLLYQLYKLADILRWAILKLRARL
ncbi:MAG TPA: peptidoglycan bridge formation glycyltransferase FemA/FemB family protein [Patescibacteria group bacterium]|nr:peptidoglycan bridge formation glycyltransferase FemA/FemB family protein [Patescibacteria group bacterium]